MVWALRQIQYQIHKGSTAINEYAGPVKEQVKSVSRPLLIAEIKTQSPFGFKSARTWDELFEIAVRHGDWISIHTSALWGGSLWSIRRARALTRKPILAKGLHASIREVEDALEAGADYVLCVDWIPSWDNVFLRDRVIYEPFKTMRAVWQWPKVVCNQRDLATGKPTEEPGGDFTSFRSRYSDKWLCQASMIKSWDDVHPEADAVLVGEHLEDFVQQETARGAR